MLSRLFHHGRLKQPGAFFNAVTGHMSALPIDPESWKRTRRRSVLCARKAKRPSPNLS
jgi:hypothetical protein